MRITQETRRRAVVRATDELNATQARVLSIEEQLRTQLGQVEIVKQQLADAVAERMAAEATLEAVSTLLAEGVT